MCKEITFEQVIKVPQVCFDATTRIVKNTDALNHMAKLFMTAAEAIALQMNHPVIQPIVSTLQNATKWISVRNWIGGANELISGEAAWKKPISETIPNYIRVASKTSLLISNIANTLSWLIEQGFVYPAAFASSVETFLSDIGLGVLTDIAAKVGELPVFGVIGQLSLKEIQKFTGLFGIGLDLVDIARDAYVNGVTIDTWLLTAGDIAKIGVIFLAGATTPAWIILGFISAGTAATSFLVRFIITEYKLCR